MDKASWLNCLFICKRRLCLIFSLCVWSKIRRLDSRWASVVVRQNTRRVEWVNTYQSLPLPPPWGFCIPISLWWKCLRVLLPRCMASLYEFKRKWSSVTAPPKMKRPLCQSEAPPPFPSSPYTRGTHFDQHGRGGSVIHCAVIWGPGNFHWLHIKRPHRSLGFTRSLHPAVGAVIRIWGDSSFARRCFHLSLWLQPNTFSHMQTASVMQRLMLWFFFFFKCNLSSSIMGK